MSTPKNTAAAAERHYRRTGHRYQVRTMSGRLVASNRHIEAIEDLKHQGRDRQLWKRVVSFNNVHWI